MLRPLGLGQAREEAGVHRVLVREHRAAAIVFGYVRPAHRKRRGVALTEGEPENLPGRARNDLPERGRQANANLVGLDHVLGRRRDVGQRPSRFYALCPFLRTVRTVSRPA